MVNTLNQVKLSTPKIKTKISIHSLPNHHALQVSHPLPLSRKSVQLYALPGTANGPAPASSRACVRLDGVFDSFGFVSMHYFKISGLWQKYYRTRIELGRLESFLSCITCQLNSSAISKQTSIFSSKNYIEKMQYHSTNYNFWAVTK